MRHCFDEVHPIVAMIYFICTMAGAMLTLSPAFLCVSLLCAAVYAVYLCSWRKVRKMLGGIACVWLVIALANPLFNHRGLTVLFTLFENPVTLEATVYGVCSGGMLAAVILWFMCFNEIMRSDKLLYVFSRILPHTGLMLSMILKWVPLSRVRARIIRQGQLALTGGSAASGKRARVREAVRSLSVLMAWSMEDSIETADAMHARGFGTVKRRSTYALFRWTLRDTAVLAAIALLACAAFWALLGPGGQYAFYPRLGALALNGWTGLGLAAYGALLLFPLLWQGEENLLWKIRTARR